MLLLLIKVSSYLFASVLIVFLLDTARSYRNFKRAGALVKKSAPFERQVPDAEMKVLVLGDSTAVGTGVINPRMSTAGRLSALYPQANLKNLAVNGLKLSGLLSILENVTDTEHYLFILVQIGANDIIRFTPLEDIERDIDTVLSKLSKQADTVIVLHSGDVGQAPFFPLYIRPFLSNRSFRVRDIYQKASSKYGVKYVDLIDSPVGDLLKGDSKKYYASDLLHLSDDGYGLWFSEIKKKIPVSTTE